MFPNSTSNFTLQTTSCSDQLRFTNALSVLATMPVFDRPIVCILEPRIATTFTWHDRYIAVATITTTFSIFNNTTVINLSTYTNVTAVEELSKFVNRHPIDSFGTKILAGTDFTDAYGVVYHVNFY